ncbi:MAG: diguanylate cyclase [Vicinamibacterales bacterium]
MTEPRLFDISRDVRTRVAAAIREHEALLTEDIVATLGPAATLDGAGGRALATVFVESFASVMEQGGLETRRGVGYDLCPVTASLSSEQVVHSIHRSERVLLDDLARDHGIGARSDRWPLVTHAVRSAAFDIVLAYSERNADRASVRDHLTTLMAPRVLGLAVEQEIARAYRYGHAMSLLLFDIDDLADVNADQGHGAGDRLLERLGILARHFFRNYDWVARHRGDAIAVLLPETELDQAAGLATRFREMVRQRLLLVDHKTGGVIRVTVSAAAVGTDLVHEQIDAGDVFAEAEAAVFRAKLAGGNRTERVALLPSSVTILGAATLLGVGAKQVVALLRNGVLSAARRGRHFHIECARIEDYKRTRDRTR